MTPRVIKDKIILLIVQFIEQDTADVSRAHRSRPNDYNFINPMLYSDNRHAYPEIDSKYNSQVSMAPRNLNVGCYDNAQSLIRPLLPATYEGTTSLGDYLRHFKLVARTNRWSNIDKIDKKKNP
jgi:hypothetical protein